MSLTITFQTSSKADHDFASGQYDWIAAVSPMQFRERAIGGVTSAMVLDQFFLAIVVQPVTTKIGFGATYGTFGVG